MDELSNLIQEAKPLYRQRKQRKIILKTLSILVIPLFFTGIITDLYIQGNDVYLAMENNSLQIQLLEDDFGLRH